MDFSFLLKGLLLGFSIAAPVGPIGVLCIRRTLTGGFLTGLLTGLGAATADAMYGAVAAFGLTSISAFLVDQQFILKLVGGIFLCYLGVRTFFAKPAAETVATDTRGLPGAYASTFFLTVTNPATILSFAAVFVGLGLGASHAPADASLLVLGVLVGSALWWLLLASGMSLLRSRLDYRWLGWINRISGAIIVAFGLFALASLLF